MTKNIEPSNDEDVTKKPYLVKKTVENKRPIIIIRKGLQRIKTTIQQTVCR